MRNKKKISYDDIFTFLKNQYFEKFEIELKPLMFHLDCEQATITSFFRFEILNDETLENSLKIQLEKYIKEYLIKLTIFVFLFI